MEWVERYKQICAELEARGIDPGEAALVDRLHWCRDKVESAGALDLAEELIEIIDAH